jgi:hypothetical protein
VPDIQPSAASILPRQPAGAALVRLAARVLETDEHGGIEQPVGQRLPAAHVDALPACRRDEALDRREVVEVFDDHARIEDRGAVVEHQTRDLARRIGLRDRGLRRPDVFSLVAVLDALFGENDPNLADVRTGVGADQLHDNGRRPGDDAQRSGRV